VLRIATARAGAKPKTKLESEGNLDNSWTTLSNNIAGTGGANQTLDAGLSNLPQQFYRVALLP